MSGVGDVHVIAVHGNGGGGFRFSRVTPFLPSSVVLHAPTLPGFGDRPLPDDRTRLSDWADDLLDEIVSIPRPRVVLGHGIGGSFVLELLREHADAVDGVILHAPVGARLDRRRFPRLMRGALVRRLAPWLIGSPLLRPLWSRMFFRDRVPADYRARFFGEYRRCRAFGRMFDLIDASWFESLEPRAIPAYLLWGEKERLLTVDQIDAFRRLLPDARVHRVPEWDHFPMIDAPEDYARELARIVRELAGAGTASAT